MAVKAMICVVMAYLLGGLCTGYYLVRFKAHLDIREVGSGGVGARNVGRLLGKSGFFITVLGDSFKGVFAVWLARRLEVADLALALVLMAVIAGHIWPITLQFRGGRGIATAIGAYLVYDPRIVLFLLGITGVLMVFRRGFILSGLVALLLLPMVALVWDGFDLHTLAALAGSSVIIVFAHRKYIRKAFGGAVLQEEG